MGLLDWFRSTDEPVVSQTRFWSDGYTDRQNVYVHNGRFITDHGYGEDVTEDAYRDLGRGRATEILHNPRRAAKQANKPARRGGFSFW